MGDVLEQPDLPATMLVAVHRLDDEMARIGEYSPGFAPDRFAAHEAFLLGEVRSWVSARFGVDLPADRTAAFGVSAGGELALALGVRHPDVFGRILCASPGGGYPPPVLDRTCPPAYFVAGTLEPWFMENAMRWVEAIRSAGVEVVVEERAGDHGGPFWREELPAMVRWAFGRPS